MYVSFCPHHMRHQLTYYSATGPPLLSSQDSLLTGHAITLERLMSRGRRSLDLELPPPSQIVKLFTNSTPRADFHDMLMVCPTSPRYTQSVENLHFGVRNFAPLPRPNEDRRPGGPYIGWHSRASRRPKGVGPAADVDLCSSKIVTHGIVYISIVPPPVFCVSRITSTIPHYMLSLLYCHHIASRVQPDTYLPRRLT